MEASNKAVGIQTSRSALQEQFHVMNAVILRDVRTRFFDHGLGFFVVSLWPLAHMLILLTLYGLAGRQAPFGESLHVFFATGLVPTLAFMYISRYMSLSLVLNRPMLAFPVVRVADILMARAFLEIIAAFFTLFLIVCILYMLGDDPYPIDLTDAVFAYLASLLLSVGIGVLVGVIVMFFNFFAQLYALFMVVVYLSSGILFVSSSLPDAVAIPLSWNPVFQCVEWMRSAYYLDYGAKYLSREYVVGFGLVSLVIGLVLERLCRRKMFEG